MGLSAAALADLVGVTRQAISQYENGPQTPAPDVMRRISDRLGLPIHFFLRPCANEEDGPLFYRSMASATRAARLRATARFRWTLDIVSYLRTFVDFPKVNFPALDLPRDPLAIGQSDIEHAATATRRHWRLGDGPISNVALLLQNNGTIVARQDLAADTLDAFSTWADGGQVPYIVLNSGKGSAVRARFNVAHELGHLVIHRFVSEDALARADLFRVIEDQAHAFARAFLMPAKTFAADMVSPTLDCFRSLKPKWKVAIQAMIFRARDLGLVTPDQEEQLRKNLARRGWRLNEPYDDELPTEETKLLPRSVELVVKSRAATWQDIVFQNALPPSVIEELVGLPRDFTDDPDGPTSSDPPILRFPAA